MFRAKYRIIKCKSIMGKTVYAPQKRSLFLWLDMEMDQRGNTPGYDTIKEAEKVIIRDQKKQQGRDFTVVKTF